MRMILGRRPGKINSCGCRKNGALEGVWDRIFVRNIKICDETESAIFIKMTKRVTYGAKCRTNRRQTENQLI